MVGGTPRKPKDYEIAWFTANKTNAKKDKKGNLIENKNQPWAVPAQFETDFAPYYQENLDFCNAMVDKGRYQAFLCEPGKDWKRTEGVVPVYEPQQYVRARPKHTPEKMLAIATDYINTWLSEEEATKLLNDNKIIKLLKDEDTANEFLLETMKEKRHKSRARTNKRLAERRKNKGKTREGTEEDK